MLTPDQVADYLRQNPGFFEQNVDLLVNIQIPHPHGGRAVSIGERQLVALREKTRLLEEKLRELIGFGEENDAISEKVHRLACRLLAADGLAAVLDTASLDLIDHFAVPHVAIRLWNASGRDPRDGESPEVAAEMREFVSKMGTPYCGHHAVYESHAWFGEAAPRLKSFALVALGQGEECFGVLALASEDPQRFFPEMGTLYLARIGELVASALRRHVDTPREPAG